jgi:hypothetical protein
MQFLMLNPKIKIIFIHFEKKNPHVLWANFSRQKIEVNSALSQTSDERFEILRKFAIK